MKSLEYVAITQPGKVEKHFVGRASVDGKSVVIEFPVSNAHTASVTAQRLNYAREHMGDMDGSAITVPSPPASKEP